MYKSEHGHKIALVKAIALRQKIVFRQDRHGTLRAVPDMLFEVHYSPCNILYFRLVR